MYISHALAAISLFVGSTALRAETSGNVHFAPPDMGIEFDVPSFWGRGYGLYPDLIEEVRQASLEIAESNRKGGATVTGMIIITAHILRSAPLDRWLEDRDVALHEIQDTHSPYSPTKIEPFDKAIAGEKAFRRVWHTAKTGERGLDGVVGDIFVAHGDMVYDFSLYEMGIGKERFNQTLDTIFGTLKFNGNYKPMPPAAEPTYSNFSFFGSPEENFIKELVFFCDTHHHCLATGPAGQRLFGKDSFRAPEVPLFWSKGDDFYNFPGSGAGSEPWNSIAFGEEGKGALGRFIRKDNDVALVCKSGRYRLVKITDLGELARLRKSRFVLFHDELYAGLKKALHSVLQSLFGKSLIPDQRFPIPCDAFSP